MALESVLKNSSVVAVVEGGVKATGTITVISNTFGGGESVSVNGLAFTEGVEWAVGGDADATAQAIADSINASNKKEVSGKVVASVATNVITITSVTAGTVGNQYALVESTSGTNFTLSAATLENGADAGEAPDAPTLGEQFIQIGDGIAIEPSKELVERTILTPNKGKIKPRVSTKAVSGSLPVEWKGSGVEGARPEVDVAMRGLLGGTKSLKTRITTGAGHTLSNLNIPTHDLDEGDFLVLLEAGDHSAHFVQEVVDANNVTIFPPRETIPSDAVEIAKSTNYFPEGSSEPEFTVNAYWGNRVLEQATGVRPASVALENITTGQTPNMTMGFEGRFFDETTDTAAPVTPVYDDEVPPIALSVSLWVDGECPDMNELSLNIENTIAKLNSVKSANGTIAARVSERAITGTLTPYLDAVDPFFYDKFNNNEDSKVACIMFNPSETTPGEFDLGSVVGFYCPQCLITTLSKADNEGILTRALEYSAHAGSTGDKKEVFIGYC